MHGAHDRLRSGRESLAEKGGADGAAKHGYERGRGQLRHPADAVPARAAARQPRSAHQSTSSNLQTGRSRQKLKARFVGLQEAEPVCQGQEGQRVEDCRTPACIEDCSHDVHSRFLLGRNDCVIKHSDCVKSSRTC